MAAVTADLDLPPALAAKLEHYRALLPPVAHAELVKRLRRELQAARADVAAQTTEHDSPGALAVSLGEQQKPHLQIIDRLHQRAAAGEQVRALVAMPPRHGKTRRLLQVGSLWRLNQDPTCRIMMVSGSKSLVEQSSRWVRDELERPGAAYRVQPRRDVRSVSDWQVEGGAGGGIFVGSMTSRIIGRGADLLGVDDLIGSPQEAESEVYREAAWRFLQAAFGPLEPGASAMIVNSRWHADDPIGRLLKEQPGVWEYHEVPALSETHGMHPDRPDTCLCGSPWLGGHTDPIGRAPGVALWPERYDVEALEQRRLLLGSHYFAAQYQQKPRRREGGLWKEPWITEQRVPHQPVAAWVEKLVSRAVAVDPSASDSDDGDEAGIVAGGRGTDGDAYIVADLSGTMTPEGWARTSLVAAIEFDAVVVYEQNLTPAFVRRSYKAAWEELQREAAGELWTASNPPPPGWEEGMVARVTEVGFVALPRLMPRLLPVKAKVGKTLRAEPVAQRYEQKRVHHAGVFTSMEDQQLTWRGGSDSPDRLDAVVHLVTFIGDTNHGPAQVEVPAGVVPTGAGAVQDARYR